MDPLLPISGPFGERRLPTIDPLSRVTRVTRERQDDGEERDQDQPQQPPEPEEEEFYEGELEQPQDTLYEDENVDLSSERLPATAPTVQASERARGPERRRQRSDGDGHIDITA